MRLFKSLRITQDAFTINIQLVLDETQACNKLIHTLNISPLNWINCLDFSLYACPHHFLTHCIWMHMFQRIELSMNKLSWLIIQKSIFNFIACVTVGIWIILSSSYLMKPSRKKKNGHTAPFCVCITYKKYFWGVLVSIGWLICAHLWQLPEFVKLCLFFHHKPERQHNNRRN